MSELGPLLKAGRKSAGLTQRDMAELLGLDFTYISKIENHASKFPPSDRVLAAWAHRCVLDVDDVFHAAGKCPPDLLARLITDRAFVRRVRRLTTTMEEP